MSNSLPDCVQYDLFSYRVFDYIPPLQQCYRCFKFNHTAKVCNSKQRCSCCSGDHFYRDCDKPNELCCANCNGPHLAISKLCPIKMKKIEEKRHKISYASITNTKIIDNSFPALPKANKTAKIPYKFNDLNNSSVSNVNIFPVTPVNNINNTVPNVNKPVLLKAEELKAQLLVNNDLTMAIVRTLISLANKTDNTPITTTTVKDMLFKNLS